MLSTSFPSAMQASMGLDNVNKVVDEEVPRSKVTILTEKSSMWMVN